MIFTSLEVIAAAAAAADIAIHLAFDHERCRHKGDFLGFWIGASKARGYVPYTANGVWTACSYDAAAQCVADTLKVGADLPNPVTLQLVAGQGVPHKYIADIFAGKLSIPAKELEPDELAQIAQLGPLAGIMTMTRPAKAELTKEVTGWVPRGEGLLTELKKFDYAQHTKYRMAGPA